MAEQMTAPARKQQLASPPKGFPALAAFENGQHAV